MTNDFVKGSLTIAKEFVKSRIMCHCGPTTFTNVRRSAAFPNASLTHNPLARPRIVGAASRVAHRRRYRQLASQRSGTYHGACSDLPETAGTIRGSWCPQPPLAFLPPGAFLYDADPT